MKVKAAPGLQVPKENDPRSYFTDDEAVDVEATPYIVRRLANEELVEVSDQQDTGVTQ